MTLLLLAAAAIAVWAWRAGHLQALRFGDVAAGVAALGGLSLLRHGTSLIALAALGGAAMWFWVRHRRGDPPADVADLSAREARALLELAPNADADMIRAAHRRLILRVHPDAGGSAELARRVNLARDVLLARASRDADAAAPMPRRS